MLDLCNANQFRKLVKKHKKIKMWHWPIGPCNISISWKCCFFTPSSMSSSAGMRSVVLVHVYRYKKVASSYDSWYLAYFSLNLQIFWNFKFILWTLIVLWKTCDKHTSFNWFMILVNILSLPIYYFNFDCFSLLIP